VNVRSSTFAAGLIGVPCLALIAASMACCELETQPISMGLSYGSGQPVRVRWKSVDQDLPAPRGKSSSAGIAAISTCAAKVDYSFPGISACAAGTGRVVVVPVPAVLVRRRSTFCLVIKIMTRTRLWVPVGRSSSSRHGAAPYSGRGSPASEATEVKNRSGKACVRDAARPRSERQRFEMTCPGRLRQGDGTL
jgi:hypothetical protein